MKDGLQNKVDRNKEDWKKEKKAERTVICEVQKNNL